MASSPTAESTQKGAARPERGLLTPKPTPAPEEARVAADKKRQAQEQAQLTTVEEHTSQEDALSTQSKPEHDVELTDSSDADVGDPHETGPTRAQAEAVQQVLACRSNEYREILNVESQQPGARAQKESVVNSFRKRGCLTQS